jgi:hypothetical protein
MSAQSTTTLDLVKFLFLADIDINQAEYILDNFPNFTMDSYDEFFEFFKQNGIKLERYKKTTPDERLNLLEKFRSFKQTYEYEIVKKYIAEEKNLALLLGSKDAAAIKTALEGIEKYNSDPVLKLDTFDYYIARKILTGNERGVLPSEQLRQALEELIRVEDIFPIDGELTRDEIGRITSFQNIFRNSGKILVPTIDDRYRTARFNYILQRNFSNLDDAVDAEANIQKKFTDIVATSGSLDDFLNNLGNLTVQNRNSVAGLEAQIAKLQEIVVAKQQLIDSMVGNEIEHEAFIDSIAIDNLKKDQEIEDKDAVISGLQETIDNTLTGLGTSVSNQITAINSALENLSQNASSQNSGKNASQDAEITALKAQIAALQATVNSLKGST